MEREPSGEELKTEIFSEIGNLMQNPPSEQEVIEHDQRINAEAEKVMKDEAYTDIDEKVPGSIEIPDFQMLQDVFESRLNLPHDYATSVVEHEAAHFLAAERHGIAAKIYISIYKSSEHGICITPFVSWKMPDGITLEQRKKILADISNAPESLSDRDREYLKLTE